MQYVPNVPNEGISTKCIDFTLILFRIEIMRVSVVRIMENGHLLLTMNSSFAGVFHLKIFL